MWGVIIKLIKSNSNGKELRQIQAGIKKSFNAVKEEFNVHLDSINLNTTEIQSLYEYLSEVDVKIDKLNERLDEIQMYINPDINDDQFNVELTHREQEVFVVLYAAQDKITAVEIAKKLGFTDEMVNRYVYNLITKGIPVLKQFVKKEMYLNLDLKFKDLQARKGVVQISESISKQLLDDKAL